MSLVQTLGRQLLSQNFWLAWEWELGFCEDNLGRSYQDKLGNAELLAQGDNRLSDSHCGRLRLAGRMLKLIAPCACQIWHIPEFLLPRRGIAGHVH